jgi:hypothetical protein
MTSNDLPFSDLIGCTFGDYVIKDIISVYATDEYGNKLVYITKTKPEEEDTNACDNS